MMSLTAIRNLSDEAARQAAIKKRLPYVPNTGDIFRWRMNGRGVEIPNLGSHVPDGWEVVDEEQWLFVDKTGMGADDEPALNLDQFLDRLTDLISEFPNRGYAIVEEGQFQCHIAPFEEV